MPTGANGQMDSYQEALDILKECAGVEGNGGEEEAAGEGIDTIVSLHLCEKTLQARRRREEEVSPLKRNARSTAIYAGNMLQRSGLPFKWKGGTLALAVLYMLATFITRPSSDDSAVMMRKYYQASHEVQTHDGDRLCVASLDDGRFAAASIISERGHYVNLELPVNYEAYLTIECTLTNQTTGDVVVDNAHKQLVIEREQSGYPVNSRLSMYYEPAGCDEKGFQPGYLDRRTGFWTDCASREVNAEPHKTLLAKDKRNDALVPVSIWCPSAIAKRESWVSFVGDSVTRQIFNHIVIGAEIEATAWRTGRASEGHPDLYLGMVDSKDYRLWLSFAHDFVNQDTLSERWEIPRTWGEFLSLRGEGTVGDDAGFATDKVPDLIIYSPGYCSSALNASDFGRAVDGILGRWEGAMAFLNSSMPDTHVMLNMMPAPWLIPDDYANDRPHRTQLNEYRKNLAIIDAVRRHGFVRSVLDLFSVELPFNGGPGDTAHRDAVHIGSSMVLRIASDLVIDKICNSHG